MSANQLTELDNVRSVFITQGKSQSSSPRLHQQQAYCGALLDVVFSEREVQASNGQYVLARHLQRLPRCNKQPELRAVGEKLPHQVDLDGRESLGAVEYEQECFRLKRAPQLQSGIGRSTKLEPNCRPYGGDSTGLTFIAWAARR